MQILVSDYDGTLNPFYFKPLFNKNIDGIKEFKANGNLFVISTARKPKHILNEIHNYSIPYYYLICSNGNIILDNNGYAVYINGLTESEIFLYLDIIEFLYGIKNIGYYDFDENLTFDTPYSVRVDTNKFIKSSSLKDLEFGMKINIFLKKISFFHQSNKRAGLLALLKKLKLSVKNLNIYSIGNSINDIEMLKEFNGYKVPYSNPYLLFYRHIPMVDSVYTLTKKLQHYNK